jgi:3-oxoacyl-[acyl-carrier-protein] synthase-1
MKIVFVFSNNIISPLGNSTAENFKRFVLCFPCIQLQVEPEYWQEPFYASLFEKNNQFFVGDPGSHFTKFEKLLISSIGNSLQISGMDAKDPKTILIISSTKGNIHLLETGKPFHDLPASGRKQLEERIALPTSAQLVGDYFHFVHQPIVVSHACVSGLLGIIAAMRLLQSGQYEHAVVAGADIISKFVLAGFQSFQAISDQPCRPFDADRNGLTLGEAAGTVILSSGLGNSSDSLEIAGGSISNDANHISGPSRTGKELYQAIQTAMKNARVSAREIDFISAHGTATLYNDEMEAKAITLAKLQEVPMNSLKGYFGHTLGAAGLIESIVSMQSLKENLVLPTAGFSQPGTSEIVNVCSTLQSGQIKNCLKTASGFGGCNAALVIRS